MYDLIVGISKDAIPIIDSFIEEINMLKKRGLNIEVSDSEVGNQRFFDCYLKGKNNNDEDILKQYIANVMADVIIKHWEIKIVDRIIQKNYNYFSSEERFKILRNVYHILSDENADFYWISKKAQIVNALIEYMKTNNTLNIEGFINFRLKDYLDNLNDVVDKAVDDYLVEREYNEFIKLLKYFVDLQDSKYDEVHVLIDDNMKYTIYDDNNNVIEDDFVDSKEYSDENINNDDLLISALITIAPQKIYLHSKGTFCNTNLINTLKNVFDNRLVICTGCEICKNEKSLLKK